MSFDAVLSALLTSRRDVGALMQARRALTEWPPGSLCVIPTQCAATATLLLHLAGVAVKEAGRRAQPTRCPSALLSALRRAGPHCTHVSISYHAARPIQRMKYIGHEFVVQREEGGAYRLFQSYIGLYDVRATLGRPRRAGWVERFGADLAEFLAADVWDARCDALWRRLFRADVNEPIDRWLHGEDKRHLKIQWTTHAVDADRAAPAAAAALLARAATVAAKGVPSKPFAHTRAAYEPWPDRHGQCIRPLTNSELARTLQRMQARLRRLRL